MSEGQAGQAVEALLKEIIGRTTNLFAPHLVAQALQALAGN